ncbi:hypothetical protein PTSG_05524 [Salpingoeca rosetta]|uniref:Ammonium transporter AmtB-like domain-containing protein n=1 Tax=Salpingoeca rosetta (strain ATCC 50818 / BSB-021) TaxID=946362 RepID=F2UBG4_SALR5|nr:uncharacterized protein PTSG_05524 [Salpingoeca rosetta]EGD73830.1 hypothetical protein PTSG_05524 [Salpingoeca rosetta]|eukprot:XP_004993393.1 hypothetical protein PTSG_05524 [Salpingoeca rosetta]
MLNNTALLAVGPDPNCNENVHGSDIERLVLLIFGGAVIFMQCGFAMLEAGFLPKHGVANILFKNMSDSFVGLLGFYIFGYALAFGGNFDEGETGIILGTRGFALAGVSSCELPFFLFQYAFAATSVTIISGALGTRSSFTTYMTYSFLFPAFIYPLPAHWLWAKKGWLLTGSSNVGVADFAGAGAVHMVGGMAALVGCMLAGPGFDRGTQSNFKRNPPHSIPLVVLGLFILSFGFLFFNGGSVVSYTLRVNTHALSGIGLAMINTVLAASGGGLAMVAHSKLRRGVLSITRAVNGSIAGMVAVSACAGFVQPWAALIVGVAGGISYLGFSTVLQRRRVDDAIDASSAHFAPGACGLLLGPWLFFQQGIVYDPSPDAFRRFGWHVLGVLVLSLWTAALSFVMFVALKLTGVLLVSEFADRYGVDRFEHDEVAYDVPRESNIQTLTQTSPHVSPVIKRADKSRQAVV